MVLAITCSPAEICVLYELERSTPLASTTLCARLGWEPDYLQRVVSGLEDRLLVRATRSIEDPRHCVLALTVKGGKTFADVMARIRNTA